MEKVCERTMINDKDPMHKIYLTEAYKYARDKSHDKHTQIGCVLVSPHEGVVTYSTNTYTHGVIPSSEMLEKPRKYTFIEHAERNAIYRCALKGYSTSGLTMYCPWWCCAECARGIVQSGITRFVGHHLMYEMATDRWRPSIDDAIDILAAGKVEVINWEGKIDQKDVHVLFNGETIRP